MIVSVVGAGPAGTSAALAALGQGAQVKLFEKSHFPRHKVCGEFLSPEAAGLLERLGVWAECEREKPATLRRVFLSLGERTKSWTLSEPARGLSRYRMDEILLDSAVRRGAELHREHALPQDFAVLAHGRQAKAQAGNRIFGFKAHFEGPADDVMGLYFFQGAYIGVNAVEGGRTNVCGLAPESLLKACGFQIDELLRLSRTASERLRPMTRAMDWLHTGPLVFGPARNPENCYPTGDAAAFIDPFTGSGMLGAISTGILAGKAAAQRREPSQYRKQMEQVLRGQHLAAAFLRGTIVSGWAERMLPLVPGKLLFHSTRPRLVQT